MTAAGRMPDVGGEPVMTSAGTTAPGPSGVLLGIWLCRMGGTPFS